MNIDGTPDNGLSGIDSDPSTTFGGTAELFEDGGTIGVDSFLVPGLALLNVEDFGANVIRVGDVFGGRDVPYRSGQPHTNFPWTSFAVDGGDVGERYLIGMESFVETDVDSPPNISPDEKGWQYGIVAMLEDGSIDTSWGIGGRLKLSFGVDGAGEWEGATISCMTKLPNGDIIAVGEVYAENDSARSHTYIGIIKVTADGHIDTNFGPIGAGGRLLAPVDYLTVPWGVDTDDQGRIYITGTSPQGDFCCD
jgi:hypothetical protein